MEVDVANHLAGVDRLEAALVPQASEGVAQRRRVVDDLRLGDVLGHVPHEVFHPRLHHRALLPLAVKIQELISE